MYLLLRYIHTQLAYTLAMTDAKSTLNIEHKFYIGVVDNTAMKTKAKKEEEEEAGSRQQQQQKETSGDIGYTLNYCNIICEFAASVY